MQPQHLAPAVVLAVLGLTASYAGYASCGSSFCSVNTQWESQGVWSESGLRLGLRYEYLDQNQLRSGSHKVDPSGTPGDMTTDELNTLNRNWLASADYTVNRNWSVSLLLPYVDRDHRHVFNDVTPVTETWAITGIGDARAVATFQTPVAQGAVGLRLGVKQRRLAALLLLPLLLAVPLLNSAGYLLSRLFPVDRFMPVGYDAVLKKI